ncbi:MAG: CoA-binding protein [Deltaproteobacteria bacterium]|nr:CoA-binding protein [Deltaproteobacteria bacterium]
MKNFMEPESVALIGISRKIGPGSFNIMENMIKFGFSGKIFPINPKAKEILGKKAYPNVKTVKEKIDLAIISTPREHTVNILKDCVAANVKAAILVNQGFADADSRGKEIQQEIKEIAKRDGIRILGPNTLGVLNNFNNFTTSFMPVTKERAPIGLLCQSGIHLVGPQEFSGKIGKAIDLGNACDIGFYDGLKYFGEDSDIKIIAIHMEGLNQGKEFLSLARRVVKEKPIVIHKSGSSKTGAMAAMSHTGSIAGNYQLLKSALRQTGVTFLEEGGQMPYAVKTLLNLPIMKGNRVAVITYSGGAGIMISDGLERYGLKLVSLSPKTIHPVAKLSPDWMPLGNPLDIWPAVMLHGAHKIYSVALKAVLNDPNVDGVICIAIGPLPEFSFLDVSESLNSVMEEFPPNKPIIAWTYGPNTTEVDKRFESKKRIMVYPTLEIATWALSLLRDRYQIMKRES